MARLSRIVFGFTAAALAAYIAGSILNTQFVIGAHTLGGEPLSTGLGDRLNMTFADITGTLLYLIIIAIGFAIAFIIASLLKRLLPALAGVAYPIAGAAAIGVALGLMYMNFQTVPISGARGTFGFLAQMLAGGLGGWVFGRLTTRQATSYAG